MRQLSLILLPLLALTGCDPDSEPVGQSDTGGSGSATDSGDTESGSTSGGSESDSATSPATTDSATTEDPSTTTEVSSTTDPGESTGPSESTGPGDCEESDCGPCPDGTVLEQYCDGDTWVCDCVEVGDSCDLPTYVDNAAAGKTVPVDCGTVSLSDPDEAYQAAHDCVLEASNNQEAYRMIGQLQGIDSDVWVGYAGTVGFVYGEASFFYDGGGLAGGEFIWRTDCTPEPIADCAPSSTSGMCLTCDEESTLVCSDADE